MWGFSEFKGALTENYVAQSMVPQLEQMPRYWVSSGTAEVYFIIQEGFEVIPIEVKASSNTAGKSLSVYIGKYNPSISIILSSKELSVAVDEKRNVKILNLPLSLIDWLPQILKLIP